MLPDAQLLVFLEMFLICLLGSKQLHLWLRSLDALVSCVTEAHSTAPIMGAAALPSSQGTINCSAWWRQRTMR